MVVLAPGQEIRASDIPPDVREEGTRLLPMRLPGGTQEVKGKELEFIFRTLVDLKLQVEDLRRRIDEQPVREVAMIEVGERASFESAQLTNAIDLTDYHTPITDVVQPVLYEAGMTMADVSE